MSAPAEPGVGVDERVGRDGGVIQDAGDFLGRIEPAAVRVHVENDRARARAFRGFQGASEKQEQGRARSRRSAERPRRVALVNHVARFRGPGNSGQAEDHKNGSVERFS